VVVRWSRLVFTAAVAVVACGLVTACGNQTGSPRANSAHASIFWTQNPHGGANERGSVGRARLDGSQANGRFMIGKRAPAGVALDARYVYWANYGSGTISRADLDGSDVNNRFITGADSPIGVAVDRKHIYWTNYGIDPDEGTIGRASLDGSGVVKHFIKAKGSLSGLAVDAGHIYWTLRQWDRHGNRTDSIGRANLDGSRVDRRFIRASNTLDGVAVNGRYIYWTNNGEDAIGRAKLDGTDVDQRCLAPKRVPLGNVLEGLAVDGEHVYWTNYPANAIARANLDGSSMDEGFIKVEGVPEGIVLGRKQHVARPSVSTGVCRDRSKPPILLGTRRYLSDYYAKGWGEVAPETISNGGAAASGTISEIRWSSWGGEVAVGRGRNPAYRPHGGYYRRPVVIELKASAIKRCHSGGRLVYTRLTGREQVRPGGRMGKWFTWAANMCVSYFHQ
jgi:sugar lactone lactonase YvrE